MSTFNALRTWSFIAFCENFGDSISTQECNNGSICLVFTNPSGEDTLVSISKKLPEVTDEFLADNYLQLQVCQTQPDAETLQRRQQRLANGEKCQMESYVLCPKGEGKRKQLAFSIKALLR